MNESLSCCRRTVYHIVIKLLQSTALKRQRIVPDQKFTWFPTVELSPRSTDKAVRYCVLGPEGKALIDAWVLKHAKIALPSDAWHAEAEKKALAEPQAHTIIISMSRAYTHSTKTELLRISRSLFYDKTLPAYEPPPKPPRTTPWRRGT